MIGSGSTATLERGVPFRFKSHSCSNKNASLRRSSFCCICYSRRVVKRNLGKRQPSSPSPLEGKNKVEWKWQVISRWMPHDPAFLLRGNGLAGDGKRIDASAVRMHFGRSFIDWDPETDDALLRKAICVGCCENVTGVGIAHYAHHKCSFGLIFGGYLWYVCI